MQVPTPATNAISGDLPIRSAKPESATSKMPQHLDVQDATNEQIREANQLAMMNPYLSFTDALAAAIHGKKKKTKKRRPKSKRGNVIKAVDTSYLRASSRFYHRTSRQASKNITQMDLSRPRSTRRCFRSMTRN
jgi:hypothetical protein